METSCVLHIGTSKYIRSFLIGIKNTVHIYDNGQSRAMGIIEDCQKNKSEIWELKGFGRRFYETKLT